MESKQSNQLIIPSEQRGSKIQILANEKWVKELQDSYSELYKASFKADKKEHVVRCVKHFETHIGKKFQARLAESLGINSSAISNYKTRSTSMTDANYSLLTSYVPDVEIRRDSNQRRADCKIIVTNEFRNKADFSHLPPPRHQLGRELFGILHSLDYEHWDMARFTVPNIEPISKIIHVHWEKISYIPRVQISSVQELLSAALDWMDFIHQVNIAVNPAAIIK